VKIGILGEVFPGENRVALTPDSARQLGKLGHTCSVVSGAGLKAGISDAAYAEAGVTVYPDAQSLCAEVDVIAKVRPPTSDEVKLFRNGQT